MLEALRSDLPTAFRITGFPKCEADGLLSVVKSVYFNDLLNQESNDGEQLQKPLCLPW